jgi:ABC-type spermidine/putrescine transport system permease subunit II
MSQLYEGAIIGALTGVVLLALFACWFGLMTALVVSAAQFSGRDFFKIAGIITAIGIVGGIIIGGGVGLLGRTISATVQGIWIGIFAGAITLCFGGFVINFLDTSSRQVQIKRALASGTLGLIIGGVLGGILGAIITFIIETT